MPLALEVHWCFHGVYMSPKRNMKLVWFSFLITDTCYMASAYFPPGITFYRGSTTPCSVYLEKYFVSSVWSKWCDTVYMRVYTDNSPQRSHSVCLFLTQTCAQHRGTNISLFVCSHSCGSCTGFNQGKDMVYYAMAYRFFHPWRAASALNGSESGRKRERGREGEWEKGGQQKRIREQHTLFHKVWLTNWIHWLLRWDARPLWPVVTVRKQGWTKVIW